MNAFFRCVECWCVIVADPDVLHADKKDCPACLAPGEADSDAPFSRIEVVDI